MKVKENVVKVLRATGTGVVRVLRAVGSVGRSVWDWMMHPAPPPQQPPPPPSLVRLPFLLLGQRRDAATDGFTTRPKFAIDLGTSSCAVAMPGHADTNPETATLSVGEAAPHNSRKTIGSAIYIGDDGTLVMDERWINRYLTIVKTAQGATYRSVKRELFEHYHLSGNERKELSRRLASIYEELLWLALDPANSSTVRALAAAGYDNATKAWIENGGFDVRSIDDRPLKLVAAVEGFDLCICVPNSLMPKDVETLLGAARIAAN